MAAIGKWTYMLDRMGARYFEKSVSRYFLRSNWASSSWFVIGRSHETI
jgi:hypothetical protein